MGLSSNFEHTEPNMKNSRHLAVCVAALAMLLASSAFADSRHQSWTRHGSSHSWHGSSGGHFFSHASPGRSFRSAPRVAPRGEAWHGDRAWRGGGSFHDGFHGGRSVPFGDGHRFFGRGRIERVVPYHGGYRVWLGGWGYPFFVPYRFYDPFRFRIGLFVGFPAYWDPYGYYSVYGSYWDPYYSDGYYRGGGYYGDYDRISSVGGTVQSVDLNTGVVTIEDNRTRRIISALLPPRDNRVDEIRPGDYIVLSGDWVRGRRYDFDADRLDRFDPRR
jgi:hypothetical protein